MAGFSPSEIIEAWRSAYRGANGFEPTDTVTYERGWFKFERAGTGLERYRRFDVEMMTSRLKARAARQPKDTKNPDMVERVVAAFEDDPFMDDVPVQGTSGHSQRLEHYARAAIAALTTPADGLGEEFGRAFPGGGEIGARLSPEWFNRILTALRAAQPTERAAIVAWLRTYDTTPGSYPQVLADAIERGDHLVAHGTASGDTQAGLCSTDDRQADTPATESRDALRAFVGAAYPVSDVINPRGYNWSEAYLDQALPLARAALATPPEPATASRDESWVSDLLDLEDLAEHASEPLSERLLSVIDRARLATPPEPSGQSDAVGECRYEYWRSAEDAAAGKCFAASPCDRCAPPHQETDNGR